MSSSRACECHSFCACCFPLLSLFSAGFPFTKLYFHPSLHIVHSLSFYAGCVQSDLCIVHTRLSFHKLLEYLMIIKLNNSADSPQQRVCRNSSTICSVAPLTSPAGCASLSQFVPALSLGRPGGAGEGQKNPPESQAVQGQAATQQLHH